MANFRFFVAIGAVVLLLSWSDFSRFCGHGKDGKNVFNLFSQTKISEESEDTLFLAYEDDPDIIDFAEMSDSSLPHAVEWTDEADQALLREAQARMERPDDPIELTWDVLADVKYKRKYNELYDQYFDYPVFGARIKASTNKRWRSKAI